MDIHRRVLNPIVGELDRHIAAILLCKAVKTMRRSNEKECSSTQSLAHKLERQTIRADAEKRLDHYFMHVERILNGR